MEYELVGKIVVMIFWPFVRYLTVKQDMKEVNKDRHTHKWYERR